MSLRAENLLSKSACMACSESICPATPAARLSIRPLVEVLNSCMLALIWPTEEPMWLSMLARAAASTAGEGGLGGGGGESWPGAGEVSALSDGALVKLEL